MCVCVCVCVCTQGHNVGFLSTTSVGGLSYVCMYVYLVHVELAHNYKNLNNFRQERDMGTGLVTYHSTALVEAVKSFVPSNVKGHGKVLYYQKPWLKSMAHGVFRYSSMLSANST